MHLPDRQRSRAVLIGTGRYADGKLPDLPVVRRTISDLAAALTDPVHGVVPVNHCTVLEDQADIPRIGRDLRSAASQAEDLLLVYFVGHGLVAGLRHELYLGLPDSEWAAPEFNSLEYDKLRSAVLDSAAATKIIILDCCFSGRVVSEAMADPVTEMVGQMEVDGTYVLASAGRDQVALIQPGEDHTAFTGRFLRLLRDGVPGGPELLTVDYLYRQLVIRMKAEGLSQPQKRGTSTADLLALAGNRAFTAAGQHLQQTTDTAAPRATVPAPPPPTPVPVPVPPPPTPVPQSRPARTLTGLPRRGPGYAYSVQSVAFSPDGRLLATGSLYEARLWDPATGELLRTLTGHDGPHGEVYGMAFSPDGRLLATADNGRTAQLWDPATGELLRTLTGLGTRTAERVAFSPDGRLLATASHDRTARLWDPATGELLRTLTGHDGVVYGVAFSPDGRLLATASHDGTARLWDPATGEHLRTLTGHDGVVYSVAFSPDGQLLATASRDGTARLWDPATGEHLRTLLTGHDGVVYSVAFSPDGRLLATAGNDGTARLWDPATGEHLRTLTGHDGVVYSVAFSPDGRLLATASRDGTARLWDLTPAAR